MRAKKHSSHAVLGAAAVIAAVTAALALPSATVSAAEPAVTWNVSLWGASRAATRSVEYLSEAVEQKTAGNFVIKLHFGEAISPAKENLDGLSIQAFEAADFCAGYHPGKVPVLSGLELPFLPISSYDAKVKVHEAYAARPEAKAELARWKAMFYSPHALPSSEFMGNGEPPVELSVWKGRRARALGGIGEAMRKLGAVPTSMPAPEIYTALERGVIDSVSLPFTYALGSYKIDELSKWYTANMAPGTTGCHTVFSIGAYEKLTPEFQQVLWDVKAGAEVAQGEAYQEADDKYLPKWRKMGLQEIVYTEAQLAEIQEVAGRPVWNAWADEMEKKSVPGHALVDFLVKIARETKG